MKIIINLFFIFLILLIPSIYLLVKHNKKIETTLPYIYIIYVLIMYLFGSVNLLKYSVYFIVLLAALLLILSIISFIKHKHKKELFKNLFTPGVIIYLIMILLICVFNRSKLLIGWDEFSHWGDVVKAMYMTDYFSVGPHSLSMFQSYLPGMSLFQYLFQKLSINGFYEPYLFISYQMFFVSLFLPFMTKLEWKHGWKNLLVLLLVLFSPIVFFTDFYDSIYIDPFLGALTAFCFAQLYFYQEGNKFQFIGLCLSFCMLTLTKDVGIFLAVIGIIAFLINSLKNYFQITKKDRNFKLLLKKLRPTLILILSVLFVTGLWKLLIHINHAKIKFNEPFNIHTILNVLLGKDLTYRSLVRNNFISALSNNYIITGICNLNSLSIMIILITLYLIVYFTNKDQTKEKNIIVQTLFIGQIIYTFGLLLVYITKFTDFSGYEAINLASYSRYMSIYLSAIFTFLIMIVINSKNKYNFPWSLYAMISCVILFAPITNIITRVYEGNEYTYERRKTYIDAANQVNKYLKDEKVNMYIISEHTTGFDYYVLKYSFRDNLKKVSEPYTWSIGKPSSEEDIWTLKTTRDKWWKDLKDNYDYVYLYHIDDEFIKEFKKLFEKDKIKEKQLYKIDKIKDKLILVA